MRKFLFKSFVLRSIQYLWYQHPRI